jgi:hypothetical protein
MLQYVLSSFVVKIEPVELTQLSQIRGKNKAGDSAMGVSFHHKWHQEVRPKRAYVSSAAAVSVNPT